MDYNRVILLLAVLEKRAGINLSTQDVYINVAGGLKMSETAADLPRGSVRRIVFSRFARSCGNGRHGRNRLNR